MPTKKEGFVKLDCFGRPIWRTFTQDMTKDGNINWQRVTITCGLTTSTTTTL